MIFHSHLPDVFVVKILLFHFASLEKMWISKKKKERENNSNDNFEDHLMFDFEETNWIEPN